jgi:uncharacterized repeat protein (TIGR01451 family)
MIKRILSALSIIFVLGLAAFLLSIYQRPEAKAETPSFKFAVYSDSQYSYEETSGPTFQASVNAMLNKVPNAERALLFGLGDFTEKGLVTDSTATHLDWTEWKSAMSYLVTDWTKTNPPQFVGAWGDHDTTPNYGNFTRWSSYMSAQKGLTAYSQYPSSAEGYYGSFKYQNALFIWLMDTDGAALPSTGIIDTETTYLQNIFNAAKDDTSIKWKFVFYHYPAEACGLANKADNETAKNWLNTYFVPNGVDMIFNGHTHDYLRTCPITNMALGVGGATTCENFADNQVGDPQGVIEVLATPISTNPVTGIVSNCSADQARMTTTNRNFVEIDIDGDVLNYKAWNIDNGGTNPALFDSLTIDKTATPPPTPITLTKSANVSSAQTGDLINYTINYVGGDRTYTDITLQDPVPLGTRFKSATGGGQLIGDTVTWHFNDFGPGEEGNFTVQVEVL